MKKIITTIAVAILSLVACNTADAQLRWGVVAGASFTNVPTKIEQLKSDYLIGFNVGPKVEYELRVIPVAVEGAVLFSQKGVDFNQDSKAIAGDLARNIVRTNYIEVPVNVKGYFTIFPHSLRLYAFAGPSFNFALNTSIKGAFEKPSELMGLEAKKFGVNLNAGLGVEVMKVFQISASYSAAMGNTYEFKNLGTTANDFIGAKNKGFVLSAAVLF